MQTLRSVKVDTPRLGYPVFLVLTVHLHRGIAQVNNILYIISYKDVVTGIFVELHAINIYYVSTLYKYLLKTENNTLLSARPSPNLFIDHFTIVNVLFSIL